MKSGYDKRASVFTVFVGVVSLLMAAAFFPSVFNRLFSMSSLFPSEVTALYCFSGLLCSVAVLLVVLRRHISEFFSLVLFGVFFIVGVELAARLFIVFTAPEVRARLEVLGNRTYPQYTAYQGHPFLQFTGRPSVSLQGNDALGGLSPFNNYGFSGPDFHHSKPDGVIRIVALGGSTTATGYPKIMEEFLNARNDKGDITFEVLNFGRGWYTSAHTVINFVLNIREFSPDYVVIHQGWNDGKARNAVSGFRTDYSHALTYFHEPEVVDRYVIRFSVIYRYLKDRFFDTPAWASLDRAIVIQDRPQTSERWQNMDELKPYERNIRTLLDLAGLAGIKVVLTTQPHSIEEKHMIEGGTHIDQCNEVMRRIHKDYSNDTLFVDLDRMMTGNDGLFKDVAHVFEEGKIIKAHAVGDAVLSDLQLGQINNRIPEEKM